VSAIGFQLVAGEFSWPALLKGISAGGHLFIIAWRESENQRRDFRSKGKNGARIESLRHRLNKELMEV
jgi:hypothetical protein